MVELRIWKIIKCLRDSGLSGEDNDVARDEQHLTATKASSITGNVIFATQVHSGLTALWFNSGHP